VPQAWATGTICALWGLILTWFIVGVAEFVIELRWNSFDAQHLQRSITNAAQIYPVICLSFFSVPFVLQFLASGRYAFWPRVAFCSIPMIFLAGLSSPFGERVQSLLGSYGLPIMPPVAYCEGKYALFLELADSIDRDVVQRRAAKEFKRGGQQDGPVNRNQSNR
jgi:hypothetical protein